MFEGYLLSGGGVHFPHEYMLYSSYEATPSQRQDLDAYQDSLGNLHRNVVPHDRTKIKFTTLDLDLAGKQAIQSFFAGATTNARERKCTLTYWNDETNTYKTGDFYIPDITFIIKEISSDNISYKGIEIHLIEY
jgi:hypothetical protein